MEANNNKYKGLGVRVVSALVLLLPVLAVLAAGGAWFYGFLTIVGCLMAIEWTRIVGASNARRDSILLALNLLLSLSVFEFYSRDIWSVVWLGQFVVLLAYSLISRARFAPVLGGLIYIAAPLVVAMWFRASPQGMALILYIFLTVWGTDIFAMFAGKSIGGPKLAPRLSPNKTWAGLIGAVIGSAIVGYVFALAFQSIYGVGPQAYVMMLTTGGLAVIAQMGDLFESTLKRKYNIKDSGQIIPGHGGILDRVDGLVSVLMFLGAIALALDYVYDYPPVQAIWVW
jgi:phosphatidate cytidylyltransferase